MNRVYRSLLSVVFGICLATSAAATPALSEDEDSWEGYNRGVFAFNEGLDRALLKPVAEGYKAILPELVMLGVSNFFSNLNDVVVLANNLLQFDFPQAAQTSSRLVFNTSFGILGLCDVATRMELPKTHADFGQTLGRWGVGEGVFMVLPLLGPTTLRDSVGLLGDFFMNPISWGTDSDRLSWSLWGLNLVNHRAAVLRMERALADAQIDPYIFQRSTYLQKRRSAIYGEQRPNFDADDAK